MGRKLKYKDVVKKNHALSGNKGKKRNKQPNFHKKKTYNIHNIKEQFKRKPSYTDEQKSKKIKYEKSDEDIPKQEIMEESSEESEEEFTEDPLKQLRDSFVGKITHTAVISESDTESEEDSNDFIDNEKEDDFEESENDSIEEIENETEETIVNNEEDNFAKHISYELHPDLLTTLEAPSVLYDTHSRKWTHLGNIIFQIPKCNISENSINTTLDKVTYAPLGEVPKKIDKKDTFTQFQSEMYSVINNYQDLYFPYQTFDNTGEIRFVYCLHAVNHVLKTRRKILRHNAKLSKKDDVPDEYRDQGLIRPKVLIVAPFKSSAFKIVNTIIDIMFKEDKGNVIKRNRFNEDYSGNELSFPKKNPKPEDYEKIFCGNTSDDFKIGISVTKKSLKLYSDFYSSDILVASPLGLRTIIGAEGEPERDFDFLTSIELLVLDQTEIFLMQNWDHVNHFFNHMHLKPKDLHGTDVSRVRQWCLNLWAKYYRQTLIFSSITLPEINSIFNKKCCNYAGKAKISNPVEVGCVSRVFVQVPHVFHRFEANSPAEAIEMRFNFFINKIVPQQRDSLMKQTLVFIPSYYDYVRLRNYFKKEDINFVQICEYSKEGKVARARDMFYHGDAHFLLYTERHHFYNRIRIKGIRHIVFYQPPNFPIFYQELCNLMQEINMNKKIGNINNMSISVIYSKYDILQIAAIVGTERAAKMLQSDRKVHIIVTGSD